MQCGLVKTLNLSVSYAGYTRACLLALNIRVICYVNFHLDESLA